MEVGDFCIVDDNMDKQEASEIVGFEYKNYGKENSMEPQAKQEQKNHIQHAWTHMYPYTSLL